MRPGTRIALAAQGFGRPRPDRGRHPPAQSDARPARRSCRSTRSTSSNAATTSAVRPARRLRQGACSTGCTSRRRTATSSTGRTRPASCRVDMWPLFRWRMDAYREKHTRQNALGAAERRRCSTGCAQSSLPEGRSPASEIEHESNVRRGPMVGLVRRQAGARVPLPRGARWSSAGRSRFERRYALRRAGPAGRALDDRDRPARRGPRAPSARRRRHGIGTLRDLADYYRLKGPEVAVAAARARGRRRPRPGDASPDGSAMAGPSRWRTATPASRAGSTTGRCCRRSTPSSGSAAATERMFGFHYRIEIYTPQPKRVSATTCCRCSSTTRSSGGST